MSSSWVLVTVVLVGALGLAYVVGKLITLRAGLLKASEDAANVDTSDLGLSETGPTVLHFSAEWCGPCAGVRQVVDQVCAELPGSPMWRSTWMPIRKRPGGFRCCRCPPRSSSTPPGARAFAPTVSPNRLTCARRSNHCWLDHHVIG